MALTAGDPYSQYRLGPQQNVNNAQSGQAGGTSPPAVQNANTQATASKGNPFAEFLTHVQAFNTLAQPQSTAVVPNLQTGNEQPGSTGTMDTGGLTPLHHPAPLPPPVNGNGTSAGIDSIMPSAHPSQLTQPISPYNSNGQYTGSGTDAFNTGGITPAQPLPASGGSGFPSSTPSPTYTGGNPMTPFDLQGAYNNSFNDSLKQIQGLLQPQFSYQADQLNRNMAASGAATGNINSGGYQESLGRAQSQLAGEQGAKITDYAETASENAKNRALQEFTTRLQDDTQRYGINTNAQLQQWLEGQKDSLAKYGIDVDAFMKQYAANLQLKGQMYSADQGFNAQVFGQTLQYQLGLANVDADRERNLQNFILGWGGLNNGAIGNVTGAINGTPPGNVFVKP